VLLCAKLRDTYVDVMVALGGSGDAVPYVLARSRAAVRRLGYETGGCRGRAGGEREREHKGQRRRSAQSPTQLQPRTTWWLSEMTSDICRR
jgi:hypothetical protein